MHSRHRSPADRSVPAGAGAGHSGYRSFGRGGGGYKRGGQPKSSSYAPPPPPLPPPPPPPPRRRADVLLEAGRLAAEYLVAKGLLPAISLAAAARSCGVEDGGEGGRASALSRLGRRQFDEDEEKFEERNQKGRGGRRRNRNGSYNRHGSDWGRENGRGRPWAERGRGYSDAMDDEDFDRPRRWTERGKGFLDFAGGEDSDRRGGFEEDTGCCDGSNGGGEALKAATMDEPSLPSKSEVTGESESEPGSHKFSDDDGLKAAEDSEAKRDPVAEAEENLNKKSDDIRVFNWEVEEAGKLKDSVECGACGGAETKSGMQVEVKDLASQHCPATEHKQATNHAVNLLSLCSFAKVPTKPRSSMANRNPKTDQIPNTEEVNDTNGAASTQGVFGDKMEAVPTLGPSSDTLIDQPQSSRGLTSEISTQNTSIDLLTGKPQSSISPVPEISRSQSAPLAVSVEHDLMSSVGSRCTRSDSFPDSSFVHQHQQQETSQGPPGFDLPGKLLDASVDEGLDDCRKEGMKRPREWSPSLQSQTDEYFRNLRAKPSGLPAEKLLPDHEMVGAVKDKQLSDADAPSGVVVNSHSKLEKQRQLASSSFKICDLNLMETPEVTDIPDDPVLESFPTTSAPLISGNHLSVDFGLSIGQRSNDMDGYGHCSNVDKVVPVIDVEDDSPAQVVACDISKTETEPVYPNLENFLNHPENPVDLPDIQDGYGLAISELLGNDISSCPSVQGDISNLQTGMPFHGAEGIAGVDDPLYVALGEIPIGFMDVWDQPPPEYGKFF